ncbi:MAG: hypothetical protein FWG10_06250 [Eubacteriaceae bacterium]|nr:hypothetical protein [Eubacteriaceae bacterium]
MKKSAKILVLAIIFGNVVAAGTIIYLLNLDYAGQAGTANEQPKPSRGFGTQRMCSG